MLWSSSSPGKSRPFTPSGNTTASCRASCGAKPGRPACCAARCPEAYGGAGADWLYDVVVFEEMARAGATGPGFMIHTDLVATYLSSFGSEAQKST